MRRMIYFSNDKAFLTQSPKCNHQRIFFRFSMPLLCCLVMMKTQNSYFAEKFLLDGNEMRPVITQTSVFAGKEN